MIDCGLLDIVPGLRIRRPILQPGLQNLSCLNFSASLSFLTSFVLLCFSPRLSCLGGLLTLVAGYACWTSDFLAQLTSPCSSLYHFLLHDFWLVVLHGILTGSTDSRNQDQSLAGCVLRQPYNVPSCVGNRHHNSVD